RQSKFRLARLFISHDLAVISEVADRVGVMYAGSLVELATKRQIFHRPAHPYTQGLLRAVPTLRTDRSRPLQTIEGTVPGLQNMPAGCLVEPRCEFRVVEWARKPPVRAAVEAGRWSRCPVPNGAAVSAAGGRGL